MPKDVLYQEVGVVTTRDELYKIRRIATANLVLSLFHFLTFIALITVIIYGTYTYYPTFQTIQKLSTEIDHDMSSLTSTIKVISSVAHEIDPIIKDVEGCLPMVKSYCGANG